MIAVILRGSVSPEIRLLPIAGKPLVLRQLQWLRASGVDKVVIEVERGLEGDALRRCLAADPLGWDASVVETARPLTPEEVAAHSRLPPDVPFLAVPGDVVGGGDLSLIFVASASGGLGTVVVRFSPPAVAAGFFAEASLQLVAGCAGHDRTIRGEGWAVRIRSAADAITLGAAALTSPLLLVHAAESMPGIWVCRGGRISKDAVVIAPVLVGAGAIVRPGARVGPRVFLGERCVIERGAQLAEALVAPATIVGESFTARRAVVTPEGVRDAAPGGAFREVRDPLLLSQRPQVRDVLVRFAPTVLFLGMLGVALSLSQC